jgi:hypothetical protein
MLAATLLQFKECKLYAFNISVLFTQNKPFVTCNLFKEKNHASHVKLLQGIPGGDSPISKWRIHLLKGLVQTAVSAHLQRFGE